MSNSLSDNSAIRIEQKIRNKNTQAIEAIKRYFRKRKITDTPLEFACECSDPTCDKHVNVSVDTYEKTHKRKDQFTIAKGHETPEIEKIVAKKPGYNVVEKTDLKP